MNTGDVLSRRYVIQKTMAEGGIGAVYQARDNLSGATVAIKMLPEELHRADRELVVMKHVFGLVNKLSHPGIAEVHEIEHDEASDRYYFVSAYIDGVNLAEFVRMKGGKVGFDETFGVCARISDALDYAHENSVLHKDLKPENVIIDAAGAVKVLDFGLSHDVRAALSALAGHRIYAAGALPYMAPEWFSGAAEAPALDLYALGALFYFMIHGSPPFDLHEFHAAQNAISGGPPAPLKELHSSRNRVLLKMLSPRSEERYRSGLEFIDAMRNTISRSWFPWRKLMAAALALVIAPVVLLAVFMVLDRDDIHQRHVVTKLLSKSRSTYQNVTNIGILPRFPGCSDDTYKIFKNRVINEKGFHVLELRELSAILTEQDISNMYKANFKDEIPLGIKNMPESHAVLRGECSRDGHKIELLLIGKNGVDLGAVYDTVMFWAPGEPEAVKTTTPVEKPSEAATEKKSVDSAPAIVKPETAIVVSSQGIIYDPRTRLEWYIGPDRPTTADEAKAWVESLTVGSGWRLPYYNELSGLYKYELGDRNMPAAFRTSGWYVWAQGTIKDAWILWDFHNNTSTYPRDIDARAFAVRSRR
jgi:serine/threonine protein kinase